MSDMENAINQQRMEQRIHYACKDNLSHPNSKESTEAERKETRDERKGKRYIVANTIAEMGMLKVN